MFRTSRLARAAVMAAAGAVGVALALPASSAGAMPSRAHSLRDDLIARAGGHASFRAAHGDAGTFFGTAPGNAAQRPSDIAPSERPADAAIGWMSHYGSLFGAAGTFDVVDSTPTPGGASVVRLQQTIDGLPVVAGQVTLALTSDNDLLTAAGSTLPEAGVDTSPAVSAQLAATLARRAVARRASISGLTASTPVLSVLDPSMIGGAPAVPGGARTVWATTVTSKDSVIRHQVFIDAQRGVTVLNIDANPNATRSVCDDQDVRRSDTGAACPTSLTPLSNPGASSDADAANAYRFAGAVDDFYQSLLKRNSLDNAGMALNATIHYCTNYKDTQGNYLDPCPNFPNAFWNGRQMYYGDGFASALDVIGHEMTHGVTQYTSDLFSWYQSGAINESMSDTMGELIQQIEGPQLGAYNSANAWLVGEDLPGGGFVRDMANPLNDTGSSNASGKLSYPHDPDRMTSPDYNAYQPWDVDSQGYSLFDNGGVHANAGVGNKAAYLIASGPSGTGANTSYTFNGVTMTGVSGADQVERDVKTANIYYVLDKLLSSGASYADVYNLLPQACNQLVGKTLPAVIHDTNGATVNLTTSGTTAITTGDCHQVSLAVTATAMNKQPTSAGSASGAKIAAAAPVCTNGGAPTKRRLDTFETSNPLASTGPYKRGNAGLDKYGLRSFGQWWWTNSNVSDYGTYRAPDYQDPKSHQSLWGDDADPYMANSDPTNPTYDRQDSWVQLKSAIPARIGTMLRFADAWTFDYGPVDWSQPVSTSNPVIHGDGGRVEYSVDGGKHWYDAGTGNTAVTSKALFVNGGYNGRITNTDNVFGAGYVDPNPLKGKKAFVGSSHGWTSSRLNLSPLKGKSVLLRWRIASDDAYGSLGWYVDNVYVYSCNPTTVTLTAPTSVRKGAHATLKAHVTRAGTTTALAGLPVQLWKRRHGTSSWTKVGTPKLTNSKGNVAWSPIVKTAEDFRVRMIGKLPFAPSNIAKRTVKLS